MGNIVHFVLVERQSDSLKRYASLSGRLDSQLRRP